MVNSLTGIGQRKLNRKATLEERTEIHQLKTQIIQTGRPCFVKRLLSTSDQEQRCEILIRIKVWREERQVHQNMVDFKMYVCFLECRQRRREAGLTVICLTLKHPI